MPCQTVTVEEPVTDSSSLTINNLSVSSSAANTITVSFDAKNVIESGAGEYLDAYISITIDGSQVGDISNSLSPGDSVSYERQYTGVSGGDHNVCVEIGRGSLA